MMTVEVSGVPFFSPEGEYLGMRGITRDITEVKRAREEQVKTQKLESLGLLAGGIAHDFNNLLTAIVGNISLAEFQRNNPEAVTDLLKEAEDAAVQARKLTQQLLTFAKGGEPVKTVVAVGPLVRETTAFTTRGSDVMCEFSLPDDLWPVAADEGQLSQVFHNLAINAVQAMPDGGTLTIGAMNVFPLTEAKRYVAITVTDTGVGIPAKHLPKIFDPYYSTKHHGSGLGLATCHSIITKHGGTIKVKSTPGAGTTFTVRLPATEQAAIPEKEPPRELPRGSGRILVMDDERPVRKIAQAMLASLGYTVECVSNGDEAIERYRERLKEDNPFDVVILDLTVPGGKGGRETARDLLVIDPDARLIVSSGYSAEAEMADYREIGFCAILGKPYRMQELSEVLERVLGV
jgi:CheY-like chemotaxis protein